MKKRVNWKILIISFLIVAVFASVGSLVTQVDGWYASVKPSITPPNYVFPIAWTILYIMIAFSLYFVWTNSKKKDKQKIIWAYGINLVLNSLWSILFFGLKSPSWALVNIIFMWFSIIFMIGVCLKIKKKAAYLLIPYFLWVSFATFLNYLIVSGTG
jgi:tryptophan-rich sensory protein